MTDHRRRAEKLITDMYFLSHEEGDKDIELLASALKEVEEETFARAVGSLEALMHPNSYTTEDMLVIHKRYLDALREEAAKK